MATSADLIDFEVIDAHKENIQALPSGRSAKALAQIYSPPLFTTTTETLTEAQTTARAAFERELLTLDEADDPLDIYDRYVKWTLDAFPSAQATPQSQLLPLLERATKAFQSTPQYANDPRYLKLWLQYIHLFSDAPRETFIFLARNGIGEGLALYYEEFAAWSESAGRWSQAEEIYRMGINKTARPAERLARKHKEFEQRKNAHSSDVTEEPSSPALPTARPALAAKHDPFSAMSASQAQQSVVGAMKKSKPAKMQIFADTEASSRPESAGSTKGWENLGSLAERKKENHIAPRPMAGERLKVGKTNGGMQKMMIFRDTYVHSRRPHRERQCSVNPTSGRLESVYVDLEAVYAQDSKSEFCFEELRARSRHWRPNPAKAVSQYQQQTAEATINVTTTTNFEPCIDKPSRTKGAGGFTIYEDPAVVDPPPIQSELVQKFEEVLVLNDENGENRSPDDLRQAAAKKARREERANRTRKISVMDVQHISNETKTIQLNLDSPQGTKLKKNKKKITREQTMTINTKEAMEEIYGIFSQPLATDADHDSASNAESDDSNDSTTDAESTGTGRASNPASEYGDETRRELYGGHHQEPIADVGDLTGWSDEVTQTRTTHDFLTGTSLPEIDNEATVDTHGSTYDAPTEGTDTHQLIPLQDEESQLSRSYYTRPIGALPNHRLPFMTPIAELTESSLGILTVNKQRELLSTKTPSRQTGAGNVNFGEDELLSSPFQEITDELMEVKKRVLQPVRTKSTKGTLSLGLGSAQSQHDALNAQHTHQINPDDPIIQELQCNPVDPGLRDIILAAVQPMLGALGGYHNHAGNGNKSAEIRRWAKAVAKASRTSTAADKSGQVSVSDPVISFGNDQQVYRFKRELGAGTFAPVYLVETVDTEEQPLDIGQTALDTTRNPFEAIKMEDPPSIWEWYMIKKVHDRLSLSRTIESIVQVHDMHIYNDECFLVEQYCDQGTLLDLVNLCRTDSTSAAGMDEMLAMWCAIELLRTVEALHAKHIIHGDLKGDNIMVRFDDPGLETDWSATYFASGSHGWSSKGICLIDFGRAIDMKQFLPQVAFIADWKTTEADCAEMREMRPWTYQIDYHGLAGTLHSMLFGKYMEVVAEKGAGLGHSTGKTYRIHDNFKRYWQTEIWSEVFTMLLNPLKHVAAEADGKMPLLNGMRACRQKMEAWVEDNCEKGIGLKGMIGKLECIIKEKKKRRRS